ALFNLSPSGRLPERISPIQVLVTEVSVNSPENRKGGVSPIQYSGPESRAARERPALPAYPLFQNGHNRVMKDFLNSLDHVNSPTSPDPLDPPDPLDSLDSPNSQPLRGGNMRSC